MTSLMFYIYVAILLIVMTSEGVSVYPFCCNVISVSAVFVNVLSTGLAPQVVGGASVPHQPLVCRMCSLKVFGSTQSTPVFSYSFMNNYILQELYVFANQVCVCHGKSGTGLANFLHHFTWHIWVNVPRSISIVGGWNHPNCPIDK